MAKIVKSISLLLVVIACCFLKETISTAEEDKREGKQIILSPATAPFPFYYYANSPLYNNADVSKSSLEGRVSSKLLSPPDDFNNESAGRTFFRIFGCPKCPICPGPCPPPPVIPAQSISFPLVAGECLTDVALLNAGNTISPCTRVSAAPKGTIGLTFTAGQTVLIGIAASPNTLIKLTCTAIPATAKTQLGAITLNVAVTSIGFIQIVASGIATEKLTCSWESA